MRAPGRSVRYLTTAIVVVALGLPGCGPPISAKRVDAHRVQRRLTTNVLTTRTLSRPTRNLLYTRDLVERFDDQPVGALAELHTEFIEGRLQPEDTAILAELAFSYAERGGGSPYFLAAALYAWAYLFPEDKAALPDALSPRIRLACDLYNRGLTKGFEEGDHVTFRTGTYPLPFGALDVSAETDTLRWGQHQLTDLVPVAELEVKGFPTYYRWPGLGAPLAAGLVSDQTAADRDILARRIRVPVTALLRLDGVSKQLRAGRVEVKVEFYAGYGEKTAEIAGRQIHLEAEPTAALGLMLAESPIWNTELSGFLRSTGIIDKRAQLVSSRPYRPGLIPAVFVHGTASSAARWAQLYNELDNDPRIHSRYQFWFFSYSTGNPIAYSAMLLRDALTHAVQQLDPEGKDPALQRMVVMGHSQGGLLTKAMVIESGDRFWRNVSSKSIDEISVSDASRDLLRRALFFQPLPFVRRVVFVATPQRGSYVAGSWFAHQAARLVRAPLDVTRIVTEVATIDREALSAAALRGTPTAVDNMTPGNPFVRTLADSPIAPGVAAHSIIAIKDGLPSKTADDGVVKYESAHIDGVESELIVTSAHSCQSNPHTMAEVRRILLEHLAASP
jgi:pimeloyl-ACP methyl ester carboxylesterase